MTVFSRISIGVRLAADYRHLPRFRILFFNQIFPFCPCDLPAEEHFEIRIQRIHKHGIFRPKQFHA